MPNPTQPKIRAFRPRRVLVVEDNRDTAELLNLAMTMGGHETRVTHSGAQALAAAREFRPDVAFVDIAMPMMDGFELARALRVIPELAECRLVAITGCMFPAASAPQPPLFNAHLLKPLNIHQLQGIVLALDHFEMSAESCV